MLIAAAVVIAGLNLEIDLGSLINAHKNRSPQVTCGIHTVGYHFQGQPGQKFQYAGETWTIPEEGWVELIATRRGRTYRIEGRTLPLDGYPLNQFGFGEVPLPAPAAAIAAKGAE